MFFDWARVGTDGTIEYRPLVQQDSNDKGSSWITVVGDSRQGLPSNHVGLSRSAVVSSFDTTTEVPIYINMCDFRSSFSHSVDLGSDWQQSKLYDKSPDEFFKEVSYFLSDIIVIQYHQIEYAVDEYLEWIRICHSLKRTRWQTPPFTLVYVADAPAEEWRVILSRRYIQRDGLSFEQYSENLPHPLFISNLECLKRTIVCLTGEARKLRGFNRHIWSGDDFSKLHACAAEMFCRVEHYSFDDVEVLVPLKPLVAASQCLLEATGHPEEVTISVLSCNLARYALGGDHVFHADDILDAYKRRMYETSFKSNSACNCLEKLREPLKVTMDRYEQAGDSVDKVHLQSLAQYAHIWKSAPAPWMCFTCLLSASEISLPCEHAFCEACYSRYASITLDAEEKRCPFCPLPSISEEKQSTRPQNGVGALVYKYHELIMGLIEVGIRLKPWSSHSWLPAAITFGRIAIYKSERWVDFTGGWGITWRNLVKLATHEYPYEGQVLRKGLMSAFGVDILPISDYQKQIDHEIVWPLVTNLFFLELHGVEKRGKSTYECKGTVRCQSVHHLLFQQVAKASSRSISLHVEGIVFTTGPPWTIYFTLSELSQKFDIQLRAGKLSSSIAGFPSTILGKGSGRKRQRNQGSPHEPGVKRRRLQIE